MLNIWQMYIYLHLLTLLTDDGADAFDRKSDTPQAPGGSSHWRAVS